MKGEANQQHNDDDYDGGLDYGDDNNDCYEYYDGADLDAEGTTRRH